MKFKWPYGVLILLVFGSLIGIGIFLYLKNEQRLLWIVEAVIVIGVLVSIFLYKKLVKPYYIILSGMQLLKEQDFSTFLLPVRNKEANEMIEVFNRMITQLRNERLSVREKNQFLDLLINASPQGILILDFDKQIREINPAGMRLLNIDDIKNVKGKKLTESGFELAVGLNNLKKGESTILRDSCMSVFRCVRSSFIDQGFDHPFILIEELTYELLRVEKESYERIIRMMSHEVNNSVGAIGATLSVVSDIFKQEDKTEWKDVLPAVDASYDRCGHLAQFISNLAHVVRLPDPSFSYISLNEQVRSVDALTRIECQNRNVRLILQLDERDSLIKVDGIQFEQVLVNIIKNAYESIGMDGEIRIITSSTPLSIIIEDNGPGISQEAKDKLFTPFFTTKSSGQGIGLMFVRDVLTNHHCRFSLTTQNDRTRFEILFDQNS